MILTDVVLQLKLIAVSIGIGFLIGAVFDVYRIIRGLVKPGGVATVIGDLVFWVLITFTVFAVLFYSNWGEMRFYLAIIFFVGFFLYKKLLSRIIVRSIIKTINFIDNILTGIIKIVLWPLKKAIKTINLFLHKKKRFFKKMGLLPSRIIDRVRLSFPKIIKNR
ncbi:MAG: hypothetical protein PWQ82_757 [Thermosediminibacterales bacterium]|nr:hypothetical protein [Thermosediminibacterales bacterium]MDK2836834.1 hypothetical protein [Thermosediminibacterales bacterium]